ncbi:MAG: hypothetical protein ABIM36_07790 [candidate division WOR-3 bacterium]
MLKIENFTKGMLEGSYEWRTAEASVQNKPWCGACIICNGGILME